MTPHSIPLPCRDGIAPEEATNRGSPGAGKPHAGKYEELTTTDCSLYSSQSLQIPEKYLLSGMSAELSDESCQSLFRGKVSLYHSADSVHVMWTAVLEWFFENL